jgi:uncharacterized protein
MKSHYYSFKDYLIKNYGAPFYRVPIDLALSCPHKKSKTDGCIFCAEDGARAVHLSKHLDLKQQVEDGIKYVENRYNANGNYIAYFQSYTNTNADVNKLKLLYDTVLKLATFKIVIISTRPDCLSNEVIALLKSLTKNYDLWVELGVQTANNNTLKIINRGHTFAETKEAVKKLNSIGVKTVAHIIEGLPNETHKDYCNTINEINKLPFTAVKIHNLLLLKNSPLAKLYNKAAISKQTGNILVPEVGIINLMNEYEYAGCVIDLIRRIPKERPLLRITADAPTENVIGPKWNLSKGQFLELIKTTMKENDYRQGDLKESTVNQINNESPLSALKIKTEDNSFTFYSPQYKENYHSIAGAASEAENKFIIPSKLEEKICQNRSIKLLDIGFGLGYNAVSAIKTSLKLNGKLSITSLEKDNNTLNMGISLFHKETLENKIITSLQKDLVWSDNNNLIKLIIGDARKALCKNNTTPYDIIFLDAFSPQKNPEMWSYDFLKILYENISDDGILITYSSAFPIRGALIRCGFHIGTTVPFGRKKGGTVASKKGHNIEIPLDEKDLNIITKSTAGAPYRDPYLDWTAKKIFNYKDKLSKKLRLKGIPKWFK